MAIGDIYRLGVNQVLNGVSLANTYAFEQLSDVTPGNAPEDSLMEAWTEIMTPLQALMSVDDWAMSCLTACKIRPTGGVQFVKSDATTGGNVDAPLSTNTCCLGALYGLPAGPRARGRHWYSGIPKGDTAFGRLDAGGFVAFDNFLARLIQSMKWAADNADWIIRLISDLDGLIRPANSAQARIRLRPLKSRRQRVC